MIVLGIESTCDETGCAVVRAGRDILSNVVSSQVDLHEPFGGVVPELASRRHMEVILPVVESALEQSGKTLEQVDLFAVAQGPGLIGALLVGIHVAKTLSMALEKPLVGVNHIEAHLYAAMMSQPEPLRFPCLGVVISGGHTALVVVEKVGSYRLLGQTVDDAIGESFDKVAKVLGLPYPGGPAVEKLAREGDAFRYPIKAGRVKEKPFSFSFSGVKTAVLYTAKGAGASGESPLLLSDQERKDLAASFQRVVFEDLSAKALRAAEQFSCQSILLGGGVSNNRYLRELFQKARSTIPVLWPSGALSLDNAAMIAGLGYHRYLLQGCGDGLDLEPLTRIPW